MTRNLRPARHAGVQSTGRKRRGTGPVRGPRVLIVVENEPISKSQRVSKQVDTLLETGYRVTVITRKHPGNQRYQQERRLRLLEYPPPPEAQRPLDYLAEYGYSFLAAAFLSLWAVLFQQVDVVQFTQPPDIYFPLAWVLRRFGIRVLVDQRDLMPELYAARYGRARPILLYALRMFERLSHRGADRIICTNEYQRCRAIDSSGKPPGYVSVVRNGPMLAHVAAARSDEALKRGRRYLCCWLGVMGRQDRLDLLIQSIDHLVHDLGRKDCEFAIIGYGECLADTQALTRELKLEEWVHFTDFLPTDEVFRYLATADLGLDTGLQPDISPVKVSEYMAFGLPLVAFDLEETRTLSDGAATLADPGDIKAHARAIDALLNDSERRRELGRNGRERYSRELAWDHQCRTYVNAVGQLCRARAMARRSRA